MSSTIVRLVLPLLLLAGCAASGTPNGAGGRRHLDLEGKSDELPFSHAVVVGDTVYVAGTLGLDPQTGRAPVDPAAEARLCLDAIEDKLALADLGMENVVSVQIFCPDLSLYETFNDVYRTYFSGDFPARSFIGSGPLLRGCRFEINAVAVRD